MLSVTSVCYFLSVNLFFQLLSAGLIIMLEFIAMGIACILSLIIICHKTCGLGRASAPACKNVCPGKSYPLANQSNAVDGLLYGRGQSGHTHLLPALRH